MSPSVELKRMKSQSCDSQRKTVRDQHRALWICIRLPVLKLLYSLSSLCTAFTLSSNHTLRHLPAPFHSFQALLFIPSLSPHSPAVLTILSTFTFILSFLTPSLIVLSFIPYCPTHNSPYSLSSLITSSPDIFFTAVVRVKLHVNIECVLRGVCNCSEVFGR